MAGRTWMQQALPVTFGLKAAGALSAVERHRAQLRELRVRALVVQFGGAAGTLASLGDRGPAVAKALAAELKLRDPGIPWHAQRDRLAEVATTLGLLTGTLGKIAHDVSLMMQTEVGEGFEPAAPGRGGSSTMPHKRNPVGCAVVLAAATKVPALVSVMLAAMVQEHERGLGGWHAEWETLPEICMLTAGALDQTARIMEGLQIDAARMRHNLEATHGLIMAEAVAAALAPTLGRDAAHALVEDACRRAVEQKMSLRGVLAKDANVGKLLSGADLKRLFDPAGYLGAAEQFVDRVLASRSGRKK
jgi:3-carboxy-cis,cis-muconate cycloisomerase